MLLPFGGHKGSGLSLLNDVMAGLLTGSGVPQKVEGPMNNGAFFILLRIETFRALGAFFGDAGDYVEFFKSVRPAPGFDEVMLPGEPEARTATERRAHGIPVDDVTLTGAAWWRLRPEWVSRSPEASAFRPPGRPCPLGGQGSRSRHSPDRAGLRSDGPPVTGPDRSRWACRVT